jgi:hypothetical protein
VTELFGIRPHRIEAGTCVGKFGIAGQLPDPVLKREHLVNGDDEHQGGAVQPLPRHPVGV